MSGEFDEPTREIEAVSRQYELAPADYCDPVIEVYKGNETGTQLELAASRVRVRI